MQKLSKSSNLRIALLGIAVGTVETSFASPAVLSFPQEKQYCAHITGMQEATGYGQTVDNENDDVVH